MLQPHRVAEFVNVGGEDMRAVGRVLIVDGDLVAVAVIRGNAIRNPDVYDPQSPGGIVLRERGGVVHRGAGEVEGDIRIGVVGRPQARRYQVVPQLECGCDLCAHVIVDGRHGLRHVFARARYPVVIPGDAGHGVGDDRYPIGVALRIQRQRAVGVIPRMNLWVQRVVPFELIDDHPQRPHGLRSHGGVSASRRPVRTTRRLGRFMPLVTPPPLFPL
jgi:hypothetical protein